MRALLCNDLARAVCLNRLGEIRDRAYEGQRHRAFGRHDRFEGE